MSNDDDVDLRYLQSESFLAEFLTPRFLPRNAFLLRMAANLRPGFSGQFDLETIAAVLGAAANARPGQVIHACLIFQGKGALMHICSIEPEMVCSGQPIPDSGLSFSSATAGGSPSLN